MSVETTIKKAVGSLPEIAGGCHFVANTQEPVVAPYVVFHEISGIPYTGISAQFGTDLVYQIEVFARTPEQAKGLALGVVKAVMEGLGYDLTMQMSGQYSSVDKMYQYISEYQLTTED